MATEALTRGAWPRIQWGPTITGVLCALAAHIVLGLFGAAFGFAARPGGEALGILAAVWGLVTPIVASFIGAWVAVRIAAARDEASAMLHGALVWCIGLIAGAIFIGGAVASGAMTAGTAASGNVGLRALERHDTPANRARSGQAADDAAKDAAAGTGAAGVAALLGLGGALLGAGVGRRAVTGAGLRGHRSLRDSEVRREYVTGEASGVAYRDDRTGIVTDRPSEVGHRAGDEPGLPHH